MSGWLVWVERLERNVWLKIPKGQKMKCCYCGKTFQPDPPRRRVCPVCISRRPAHLQERYATWSAMAAAAERERERVRQERMDRQGQNLQTQKKMAAPAAFPFVSVGSEPDREAQIAEAWRKLNVIPFPARPLRPHRTRFSTFDGDSAA